MAPSLGWNLKKLLDSNRVFQTSIEQIRTWLKDTNEPNIPELSEEQIVMFLLSCNNALLATKNTIKAYYKTKQQAPLLFDDRDIERDDLQHVQRTA